MFASLATRVNGCLDPHISGSISTTVLRWSTQAKFVPKFTQIAERSVKSPRTNLLTSPHGGKPLNGQVTSISLLANSNPSSLRRCREENDIFRYFDDMQSIIRSRKVAAIDRKRRKRNLSFDLVGVELNPGPNPKKSKSKASTQNNRMEKQKKKSKATSRSLLSTRGFKSLGLSQSAAMYMASVLQPCAGAARIPDMNCIPTFLTTLTAEVSMQTNPQGVCGIQFYPSANPSYAFETSASTDAVLAYNAATNLPGTASLIASASRVRLVSACLDIIYTGNSQVDGGILTGASFTAFGNSLESLPTTLALMQNSRSNTTVRAKDGISVFYRPGDSTSFDFYGTTGNPSWGALVVHLSGLSVSPLAPFMIKLTANYECVPANDTNSNAAGSKSSPVDLAGLGTAVSHLTSTPSQTTRSAAQSLTASLKPVLSGALEYGPAIWQAVQTARSGISMLV